MAPLTRSPCSSKPKTLRHSIHPKHPLHLLHIPKEFLCDGCSALGFGTRYRCHACDVDLHDICATCAPTNLSPLHLQHALTLLNQPGNHRLCDLCGDLVHGLFYTCRACDFDVHPLCTQLPLNVQLPLHPHHLLKLQPGNPAACAVCFKSCAWWRYRCVPCGLDIHLECAHGGGHDVTQTTTTTTTYQASAVFPLSPQVGLGGCAVGIPVGGYGMPPSPAAMMNQPSKGEGQTSSGRRRRKIYSVVGRLAVAAVLTSIIGVVPLGS